MKPTTEVWYRFESVGRPECLRQDKATVRTLTLDLANWLLATYMGSKIRITLARTEEELNERSNRAPPDDMIAELERIMATGGTPEPDPDGDCNFSECSLNEAHRLGAEGCDFLPVEEQS